MRLMSVQDKGIGCHVVCYAKVYNIIRVRWSTHIHSNERHGHYTYSICKVTSLWTKVYLSIHYFPLIYAIFLGSVLPCIFYVVTWTFFQLGRLIYQEFCEAMKHLTLALMELLGISLGVDRQKFFSRLLRYNEMQLLYCLQRQRT